MTNKIYVVVDKRSGEYVFFDMYTQDSETSPGYGEFYADPEEIYLDVIIDSWPRNKPPPTLDDLEIVEYVRAEVVGL